MMTHVVMWEVVQIQVPLTMIQMRYDDGSCVVVNGCTDSSALIMI